MRKAFVLLSGGMDSTTCLHKAIWDYAPSPDVAHKQMHGTRMTLNRAPCDWVEAISINYGQRHVKEADYARDTCKRLGIEHTILYLKDILAGANVMLTAHDVAIPNISYADIKGVSPTYVPFRNGTLLSLITAHAQKHVNAEIQKLVTDWTPRPENGLRMDTARATLEMVDSCGIYFGAHAEDAANWAYPDCTPEFIGAMANAIYIGSYRAIRLHTPLQWLSKAEIVTLGEKLQVDWKNTWSCYAGNEFHCGVCPTCRARAGAFKEAHVVDPTAYADTP